MPLISVNPATGETIGEYMTMSERELANLVNASEQAFRAWRRTELSQRSALLRKVAFQLRSQKERLAELMTSEMGKPIVQARTELEKCAWACDFYADEAPLFLAPQAIATGEAKSYITYQPLGIILAIMPWNFPFWQVFRFATPTLMAGNAVLLKHAPSVTGCALAIEALFREAGFPEALFRILRIEVEQVAPLIQDRRIAGVTLTGSTRAGRSVAALAGSALKKTVLELGGSDPYLILPDADLDRAVATCVTARLANTGQSCVAAKRFLVVGKLREPFERLLVEAMRAKKMGDPRREDTDLGPLARFDLRDNLHRQVQASLQGGARLLLGGEVPAMPGAYYPATVLTGVGPGQPAYTEELFGPVAAIIPVTDEADAIRIANDTCYGLGSAVFTEDRVRGERIAVFELEAGVASVNAQVRSDPRLPFGGIKASGYGRELSHFGIYEFANIKTIYVQ